MAKVLRSEPVVSEADHPAANPGRPAAISGTGRQPAPAKPVEPVYGAGVLDENPRSAPEALSDPPSAENRAAAPANRASIVVGRYQGTVVVTVHGELTLQNAAQLGATLDDLIDGQGNLSVVVDLYDATASDADCLWVFTEAAERARRRGGTIKLHEPPESIHGALQLRGLDGFVGKFADLDRT